MKIKIKIETKIENSEVSLEGLGFEEDAVGKINRIWLRMSINIDNTRYVYKYVYERS